MTPLPANVAALLDAAADRYGVPRIYPRAVAWVESGGQQHRAGKRGELGVMQLAPATARELGVNAANLAENIDGGVRYLAQLQRNLGEESGIAAYNGGPGRIGHRPKHEWPLSVQHYVSAVLARADYEAHTMGGRTAAAPFPSDEVTADLPLSWPARL